MNETPGREEKTWSAKIWINTLDFCSSLEFSKVCLILKEKNYDSADMILTICRGNI